MGNVFAFALAAAFNPTLVAASTLMMLLPNPLRLMLGYLAGALMTSITLGILIVTALDSSSATSTTENTIAPATTIALGTIALVAALVLSKGWGDERRARRRRENPAKPKGPPRWQRALSRGSARTTFVIGALLTLPGASYLAGLRAIDQLNYPTASTVLLIIAFNLVMMALLEVPMVCFVVAPEWTPAAIDRAKAWIGQRRRLLASRGLAVIGLLLIAKGLIELLA
jgi:hypothetical protein